jgi:hypothetical protein
MVVHGALLTLQLIEAKVGYLPKQAFRYGSAANVVDANASQFITSLQRLEIERVSARPEA